MKKFLSVLFCIFLFTGLSQAAKDAQWVIKKAKIKEDKFEKTTTVIFPEINYRQVSPKEVKEKTGKSVFSAPNFHYHIEVIDDNIIIKVIEHLTNLAGDKDFNPYTKALDIDGNKLNFKMERVYEPKNSGSAFKSPVPEEEFSITVTKEYLEEYREDGLIIKVYGNPDAIFHISGFYIDGVLQYLED